MTQALPSPPSGIAGRYRINVASIAARARRVKARTPRKARISGSDVLLLFLIAAAAVLLVGVAFDNVSIERSRAVPPVVDAFFGLISEAGKSQWELVPSGILVLVLLAGRWSIVPPFVRVFWAELGALAAFLFASIGGVGIIVNILKQPIGRGRPGTFDLVGVLGFEPFRLTYSFQSFPSGHAATAGALIAFGFLVMRRWRIGLMLFGLAIAASRVVVGAHYPSDIVAGLLLGYTFSLWLAHRFARRGWAFSLTETGSIRARAACLRRGFTDPARTASIVAGLADAIWGRAVWLPAVTPGGRQPRGEIRGDRQRGIDD